MIKIGVSSCFLYPDGNRDVFAPKTLCYLESDMARYLASEDVLPVLIPDLEDRQLAQVCGEMDGFIFQGGSDISPEFYGEKPAFEDKWRGDSYRDKYELKILDFAVESEKPVLGICRGFQLLNVFFGGTLYQDIDTHHDNPIKHRDGEAYDNWIHTIEFNDGKLLDRLHPKEKERKVNSVHHQGIKKLGDNLEVLAFCLEDKMIEAFHWTGAEAGRVMGIQWHPEFFHNFNGQLIDAKIIYRHFLSFIHK